MEIDNCDRCQSSHLPGAERFLTELAQAQIPSALVTMAYRPVAHRVAAAAPAGVFGAVITGQDVRRGKPHPDPYLLAAATLGVTPSSYVAVEDSPTGTRSAEAAGMPVLVVPGHVRVPPGPRRRFVASLGETTSPS